MYINDKISYMKLAQIGFLFNLAEPAYSKNIVAELGKFAELEKFPVTLEASKAREPM